MYDIGDDSRKTVLGEALFDELKAIRELVTDVPVMAKDISVLKHDVAQLKSDMIVVKAAVKDLSTTQHDHSKAIQKLQAQVA